MPLKVDKWKYFGLVGYKPHESQRKYHESLARFRIPTCGRRFGKTLMAATDREPELFQDKNKRGWIIGPCVDEQTEILTDKGWLHYTELQEGDTVLTLNQDGVAEWQECQKVNVYNSVHRMIHISQRGHDSMTTPHHRWLVGYTTQNTPDGKHRTIGYRFTTTEEMTKSNEYVLGAAPVVNLPTQPKYEDGFVELVGWYWTEGCDQATSEGVTIAQNSGPNADEIRRAATEVFGPATPIRQMHNRNKSPIDPAPRWSDWKINSKKGPQSQGRFGFDKHAGRLLRRVAPDKVIEAGFIASLTKSQLELLIDVSVRADGHERIRTKPSGAQVKERVIVQDRKDRLDPLQMAAQLAGWQTTLLYDKTADRWRLNIFERSRMFLGLKKQVEKRREISYVGNVWCPTTPNGTWLARRNGTVYFTGNTYNLGEKEFRVMWNHLLVTLGLLKDKRTKRSYNLRGGDMYIELPWGSRVEVKSATQPESLVGDEIDFAIMSEAAKHKHETWERYVRPALFDRRGGADFPSTAEGYNWYYDIWKLGQDPAKKHYDSWRFPSWMNSYLFPDGYDDEEIQITLETTSPEWFAQEIAADFSTFAGRIFSEFQIETHCMRHVFQPDWPNYIAFDWGFTNPLAAIEFQVAPNDTIYVWREHYKSFWTLNDHIGYILNRENPEGYHLDMAFGDAADPDAVQTVSNKLIPCVAYDEAKEWRTGVELIKRFLKEYHDGISYDEYERPILYPKYYVDHSCVNHIREMQQYRRKDTEFNTTDQANSVVKMDDHTIDAMRYALMHLFELGAGGSLADVMPDFQRKQPDNTELWVPQPHPVVIDHGPTNSKSELVVPSGTYFSRGMRF